MKVRILALDYGHKRIGMAISDPLGMTAQPLGFVPQDQKAQEHILEAIQRYKVEALVIGYPLSLNGTPSQMAQVVERFGTSLKDKSHLPIHYWDERFTTAESERLLVSANIQRKKRKEVRDSIAATLILQGFLDSVQSK